MRDYSWASGQINPTSRVRAASTGVFFVIQRHSRCLTLLWRGPEKCTIGRQGSGAKGKVESRNAPHLTGPDSRGG